MTLFLLKKMGAIVTVPGWYSYEPLAGEIMEPSLTYRITMQYKNDFLSKNISSFLLHLIFKFYIMELNLISIQKGVETIYNMECYSSVQ